MIRDGRPESIIFCVFLPTSIQPNAGKAYHVSEVNCSTFVEGFPTNPIQPPSNIEFLHPVQPAAISVCSKFYMPTKGLVTPESAPSFSRNPHGHCPTKPPTVAVFLQCHIRPENSELKKMQLFAKRLRGSCISDLKFIVHRPVIRSRDLRRNSSSEPATFLINKNSQKNIHPNIIIFT